MVKYTDHDQDFRDETRDIPDHRIWKIWGNEIHFKREGPQGWWRIHLRQGDMPKFCKGYFMTYQEAASIGERYVSHKKTRVSDYDFKPQKMEV